MTVRHNKFIAQYNRKDAPQTLKGEPFYGLTLDPDQEIFRDAIWNPDKTIVLCNSFAGSGKTLIALGVANLLVQYGFYSGIVYITFPVQEHVLGYLPGTEEEKILPYRQPLEDALLTLGIDPKMVIVSEDNIQALKEGRAYIEFCSDTFMRGINLEHKIVIIDEFQNSYFDQAKKVLTRIHDNSKCICIGSSIQCDIVKKPERSGFVPYLEAFRRAIENGEDRAQICELTHNHRGWLSNFCDHVMFQ